MTEDTVLSGSTKQGSVTLANARLVLRDKVVRGLIEIADGLISRIAEGDHVPPGAINCDGDFVLPGLIELHTDNLERHIEPRPAVGWPYLPAILAHDAELASAGITTVFDAIRVGSILDKKKAYPEYARRLTDELLSIRRHGHLKISHYLHLRAEVCSETLVDELAKFGPDDRIGIVSLMDHTPGQRQFRHMKQFKTYVSKKYSMSDDEFDRHVINLLAIKKRYGSLHEEVTFKEARRFGAVTASHDDTTCEHVELSSRSGVDFAEFPTTVEAAEACRDHGISVMMGAPNIIRGASHSGNVSALELAGLDMLDIVSSDYVPAALLLSAFQLWRVWDDLPRAVACVTDAPAQATALNDRGRLETGLRGDVIRVHVHQDVPVLKGTWAQGVQVA